MSPDELKLPEMGKAMVSSNYLLHKEWIIDPPPWIISRLPDELIRDFYRIKMEHLAELAKIEVQIKQLEARMFTEMVKVMG